MSNNESIYKDCFLKVSDHLSKNYSISVIEKSIIDNEVNTGSYNGLEINVKNSLAWENKLFLIIHLFGHIVQWSIPEKSILYKDVEKALPNMNSANFSHEMQLIEKYEKEAGGYAMKLLHNCNIYELDAWFTNWFYADWEYLKKIINYGSLHHSFEIELKEIDIPVTEIEIPNFTMVKNETRYSY